MRPTAENARGIVGANRYLVLATADAEGRPWSTPVYFAHVGCREFFWVSSPETVHSRNIAVRPEVGIAVFDSSVEIGTGQGVHARRRGRTRGRGGFDERAGGLLRRSLGHGGQVWTLDDVRGDSGLRLYRAVAEAHSMLAKDGRPDHRVAVDPG